MKQEKQGFEIFYCDLHSKDKDLESEKLDKTEA